MKFKPLIPVLFSTLIAMVLASCGSSSSDKDKNSSEFKEAEESLKEQIEEVIYNIPSPSEIPYLLQATGAEFNESLVNPRTKVDQYASRTDIAALNLGVYAADIGYLSSYDKTQEAIDYLRVIKQAAGILNRAIAGGVSAPPRVLVTQAINQAARPVLVQRRSQGVSNRVTKNQGTWIRKGNRLLLQNLR